MTAIPANRALGSPARWLRLSALRVLVELRMFSRDSSQVFFSFLLPVLFVVIFSTIFNEDIEGPPGVEPVPFPQYFAAGMLAAGIMSTSFASLAMGISIEQHEGQLKRLAGTPLPKSTYFAGKLGLALVTSLLQSAVILGIGVAFYGMSLPTEFARWVTLIWVFLFGVTSCSLLGIAYTRLIPTANSAPAVVQPPYLTLQFISGVFIQYSQVPPFLQGVASLFPLKWMSQGFRYALLPDWVGADEYGGEWHVEQIALALAAWLVVSFVLAMAVFRWNRGTDR